MLTTLKEIEEWLKKYDITNYTINEDLTVEVNQGVNLSNKNLKNIPIKFNNIKGFFDCSHNNLLNLKFAPEICIGFDCSYNNLSNLKYFPKKINGSLNFSHNNILLNQLYLFYSHIEGYIFSDFTDNTKDFLLLVQEQKILFEKEKLINNLENKNNKHSHLIKKRL